MSKCANRFKKTHRVDKGELLLKFTNQFDIAFNGLWFASRNESIHVLNEWLDFGFDPATKVRAAARDL